MLLRFTNVSNTALLLPEQRARLVVQLHVGMVSLLVEGKVHWGWLKAFLDLYHLPPHVPAVIALFTHPDVG